MHFYYMVAIFKKKWKREIENGKCKRDISCQIFDWKQYTIVHKS